MKTFFGAIIKKSIIFLFIISIIISSFFIFKGVFAKNFFTNFGEGNIGSFLKDIVPISKEEQIAMYISELDESICGYVYGSRDIYVDEKNSYQILGMKFRYDIVSDFKVYNTVTRLENSAITHVKYEGEDAININPSKISIEPHFKLKSKPKVIYKFGNTKTNFIGKIKQNISERVNKTYYALDGEHNETAEVMLQLQEYLKDTITNDLVEMLKDEKSFISRNIIGEDNDSIILLWDGNPIEEYEPVESNNSFEELNFRIYSSKEELDEALNN